MTGGWPYTAPENNDDEEEEEKEDTVADVPAAAQAGNDYSVDDTPTEVGGDTPPDDWDGALDDDANDMDLAASAQASNVDWLATGPMPTNSRDEEDFNLEFMRSTSNMSGLSGLSGLDRGGSEQSLSNLIPSPRGWDNGAPVPIPGADAIEAHTNVGGNKRARTSSSPRLQPMETRDALPPDGSAPGSGEHMVHMVQHNQIPAGVIEKALPAELAFALLDSKNFEPGVRPAIFNAQGTPQFLFKEKTVGGKPTKPGGPDATKADRWHNSGGSSILPFRSFVVPLHALRVTPKHSPERPIACFARPQASRGAAICRPTFRSCGGATALWWELTARKASGITSTPACGSSRRLQLMAQGGSSGR
jgi:hypothetical protein